MRRNIPADLPKAKPRVLDRGEGTISSSLPRVRSRLQISRAHSQPQGVNFVVAAHEERRQAIRAVRQADPSELQNAEDSGWRVEAAYKLGPIACRNRSPR